MTTSPMEDDDESPAPTSDTLPAFPEFQLNGDARLQFWRETYLAALPALLGVLAPGAVDSAQLIAVCRSACDLADMATAQHLARNDRESFNRQVFDVLLAAVPGGNGSK